MGKVLPAQFFPPLEAYQLVQPYGNSHLMGLLWTFMASSRGYCVFAGMMEVVGGGLLFVPRLATLGALICTGVMANVFALNLAYDVNVKLHSGHLLLMSLFLVAPEAGRLADALVLNRPVSPARQWDFLGRASLNRGLLILQLAIGVVALVYSVHDSWRIIAEGEKLRARTQFSGIWAVEDFSIDGVPVVATPTNDQRWWRLIVDGPNRFTIQMATGRERNFGGVAVDTTRTTYRLGLDADGTDSGSELTYSSRSAGVLVLSGRFDGHDVHANLRQTDLSFPLLTQRIHLIQEVPLNP